MLNATDFTKLFLSSDLHLPVLFPSPDFSVPLPGSLQTCSRSCSFSCDFGGGNKREMQFPLGNQGFDPNLLSCREPAQLGLGLAAVTRDEAGAFSPVANYPFTLLDGNSPALFCQRFINLVAAFLREVRGGKFPPLNILYESHRRRLCWAWRLDCGHHGTPAWGSTWS